jgi:hypothetical protein
MRQNLPFDPKAASLPPDYRSPDSISHFEDGRGGLESFSRPFSPHLVALEKSVITKWGYIFDPVNGLLFNHGGCPNRGWDGQLIEIDLANFQVS